MQTQQKQIGRLTRNIIVACLAIVAPAISAHATTVTNFSIADTQIFGAAAYQTWNNGLQPEMYVGDFGSGSVGESRVLVQFSLANIPAGQLITSATLKLSVLSGYNQHN